MTDYRALDPMYVEDVDEEPWAVAEDDLAPARGCLLGIVGGLALWALLILLAVAAWKVGRG